MLTRVGVSRALFFSCTTALVAAPSPSFAQNSWYVSPDFSYIKPDSDQYRNDDFGFGLAIGAPLALDTDLEMHYSVTKLKGVDSSRTVTRRQLLFGPNIRFDTQQVFSPYVSLGLGLSETSSGGDDDLAPVASAGLGYRIPLPFMRGLEAQPEVRALYTYNDDSSGRKNDELDTQALMRLRFRPTSNKSVSSAAPKPTESAPEPQKVASAQTVSDYCRSLTPGTPTYLQAGCHRFKDRDGDAVPDSTDLCPNTIPGVRVDIDGCLLAH